MSDNITQSLDKETFKTLLQEVLLEKEQALKLEYQRNLPFQDSVFDRFERAKRCGFGEGSSIYNSAFIFDNVIVGRNVWIGPYTLLDGMGGELVIGDYCVISIGSQIYTHDTILRALSGGKHKMHKASVKIGNYCNICPNVIITAGVTLGERCLVEANSVVNTSFGDNAIIRGNPARQVGVVELLPDHSINLCYEENAEMAL